jgi:hypothetical protein
MTTPRKHRGCLLWPILNDDTGQVDYWEVHEPCPESHLVRRAGGTVDQAEWLDCCHYNMEPEGRASTLAEAKALTYDIARNYRRFAQLQQLIGGNR